MSEISLKMSEICYQTRLVHIYTSKLLDGALLVIISSCMHSTNPSTPTYAHNECNVDSKFQKPQWEGAKLMVQSWTDTFFSQ